MEHMWGKNLCICSDVRDMSKDLDKVVERVLKISANDPVPLNRKGKAISTVKMNTKLMMFSNRVPIFNDAHGAMNARLLIIQMHQSFLGREDIDLADKLILEVDKIALWALEGLGRLLSQGRFTRPDSSEEARAELRVNDSPLVSFINDRVEIHPSNSLNKDTLWDEYQDWAHVNGYKYAKNKQTFYRDLIGLYGPMFKGSQAAPSVNPRITYIKGAGLLSDPERSKYTASNPPMYDATKSFDGRRERYDERNPPPY
jgi:putative DNA primase/helicase